MGEKRYTLVVIHRGPEYERDFADIAEIIATIAPDIDCYKGAFDTLVRLPPDAWERPALVVALNPTFKLAVPRGAVLKSRQIPKLGQLDVARAAGIATPPAMPFRPGMKLDPILFGEFVVTKPMSVHLTSRSDGIQLFRRRRLEAMIPADFPRDHPALIDPRGCIVQRYIDCGTYPSYIRVVMFAGEPIYAATGYLDVPRPPLTSPDAVIEQAVIAIQGAGTRKRQWGAEADAYVMARNVAEAFADVPLLAVDLMREEKSGKLYFLECNPGGNTWLFSSNQPGQVKMRLMLGDAHINDEKSALELARRRMIDHNDAFNMAAKGLVSKTRALAT
ncbi:MAG: hypothetical protein U1E46_02975 [Hyphomicrobiales bacterium]